MHCGTEEKTSRPLSHRHKCTRLGAFFLYLIAFSQLYRPFEFAKKSETGRRQMTNTNGVLCFDRCKSFYRHVCLCLPCFPNSSQHNYENHLLPLFYRPHIRVQPKTNEHQPRYGPEKRVVVDGPLASEQDLACGGRHTRHAPDFFNKASSTATELSHEWDDNASSMASHPK